MDYPITHPSKLTKSQSKRLFTRLNRVQDEAELLKAAEIPGVFDIGLKTAESILASRAEHGGFTDPEQIIGITGIGSKRFAYLTSALLFKSRAAREIIQPQDVTEADALKVIRFINHAPDAAFIAKAVELPDVRDIGLKVAEAIIAHRDEWGQIGSLAQIDSIPGIGPKRFTDLVTALKDYPDAEGLITPSSVDERTATVVLAILNQAENPAAIDALVDVPGVADIGPELAERIFLARLELGEFSNLQQIDDIRGIGPARFSAIIRSIVEAQIEDDRGEDLLFEKVDLRTRLAILLNPFLSGTGSGLQIIGSESIALSIERLSGKLDEDFEQELNEIFTWGLEIGAFTADTRTIDIIGFTQIAENVSIGPPNDVIDPAAIPGLNKSHRWFRTDGIVILEPKGVAEIQFLTVDHWSDRLTIDTPIAVEPVKKGVRIRKVMQGPLFPVGLGAVWVEPVDAVRITCRNGVRGTLTQSPHHLHLQETATPPPVPMGWTHPNTEIWVNPRPDLPPIFDPDPAGGNPFLPGEVTIAGGACPPGHDETDDDDEDGHKTVLIGVGPQVFVVINRPRWPWPWGPRPPYPWPWKWPYDTDDDGDDPRDVGPPYIYGEEIDTDISVWIKGCLCIRKPEDEKYEAMPTPEGGSYLWEIDDDEIAEIIGSSTEKIVQLKSKKIGDVHLKLTYRLGSLSAISVKKVHVIYHKFTPKDNPESEILAVPLFQPAPKVRVHQKDSLPYQVDDVQIENHRAGFLFKFDGELIDALVDIDELEIIAGEDFRKKLSKDGNEFGKFSDTGFNAKNIAVFGPGRTYVRIKAMNSIGFYGTDTIDITIKINPTIEGVISRREEDLAYVRENNYDQSAIDSAIEALTRAWKFALENPEIEIGYLNHTENSEQRIPGNEKWSIAIEDNEKTGSAKVDTTLENKTIFLEEKREELLVPKNDPKNYFIIHENYERKRVNWDKDGRLKGRAGEATTLSYLDDCCAHAVPTVGVEFNPLPGVKRVKADEPVELHAWGIPESFNGIRGTYMWKVAAHPKGADFRFDPENPATRDVKFYTDTPGIYTFKVNYELLGATSPWTYALADSQIVFEIKTTKTVHRLGGYGDELADHVGMPLYRERVTAEQPGAEIMVTGDGGGTMGQDIDLKVVCSPELEFSESLKTRAYFADNNTKDYALLLNESYKFFARAEIRSANVIQKLQVIGIRYKNLPEMKGDAVWIDVQAKSLAPPVIDIEEGSTVTTPPPIDEAAATDGDGFELFDNQVKMVVDDGDDPRDVGLDEDFAVSNPLINLILRTRDLGEAYASNAVVKLSPLGVFTNLTNGNQFFAQPLFKTTGKGQKLAPILSYNSKAATRSEAIKLYGELNGKDAEAIRNEFGWEIFGRGWNSILDMQLREFVDVDGGIENNVLKQQAEVQFSAGNRILFEEVSAGIYHVASDAESMVNDPNLALGLELIKEPDGSWKLQNSETQTWLFDEDGQITAMRDPRMDRSGSNLKAMEWVWSENGLKITDSVGRETKVSLNDERLATEIENPEEKKYTLTHDERRLTGLALPESISWTFGYTEFSLMKTIKPPIGNEFTLTHYTGKEVESVPEDIATKFWGRVARMQFGERLISIRYEQRNDEDQTVVCLDPADNQWRYKYKQEIQACHALDYRDRTVQGEQWKSFFYISYNSRTKLIWSRRDISGAYTQFYYSRGHQAKLEHLKGVNAPGNFLKNYDYNGQGLLLTLKDEGSETSTYAYDEDRQIKRIDFPAVSIIKPNLSSDKETPYTENEYDSDGRLVKQRNLDGVITTYEYDGAGDPFKTGNPTKILTGDQFKEIEWDKMGRMKSSTNHFGLKATFSYDDNGRFKTKAVDTLKVEFVYDALGRQTSTSDSLGRSTANKFDDYGDLEISTNAAGHVKTFQRDNNGNLRQSQNEDGGIHVMSDHDILGRPGKIQLPSVDRDRRDGLSSAAMPDIEMTYVDKPELFNPANEETTRVIEKTGSVTKTRHYNLRKLPVGEEIEVAGRKTASVIKYDNRGNAIRFEQYENGRHIGTAQAYRYDALGRVIQSTRGGTTLKLSRARDSEGLYSIEVLPSQANQEGRQPSIFKRLDDHGRLVKEYDGEGRLTTVYTYDDAALTCRVESADPSETGDSDTRIVTSTMQYNKWGKVGEQTDPRINLTLKYGFDEGGRMSRAESPNGATEYTYNALDKVESMTSQIPEASGGVAIVSGPDAPRPSRSPRQLVIGYEYDPMGRLSKRGTPESREKFEYDQLGRIIMTSLSGIGVGQEKTERFYYNAKSEKIATWFEAGHYVRYAYNRRRRSKTETWYWEGVDSQQARYKYDPFDNLIEYSNDSSDFKYVSSYDTQGRVVSRKVMERRNEISEVRWSYGRATNPDYISALYKGNSRTVELAYDSSLRLTGVQDDLLSNGVQYQFEYNRAGLRTRIKRPINAAAQTEFTYTPGGSLHRLRHKMGEEWKDEYLNTFDPGSYDLMGNPGKITHVYMKDGAAQPHPNLLKSENHVYDDANRLISSEFSGTKAGLYTRVFGSWQDYIKFLFPAVSSLVSLLFDGTENTEASVKNDYYFDGQNRKRLEFVTLTPDVADDGKKQVIIKQLKYGSGQALEEEMQYWYDIGQTTPKIIRSKYLYDEHGRRTHQIETLIRTEGGSNLTWAKMTRLYYSFGDKPHRIRTFELRATHIHLISDNKSVYDEGGRLIRSRQETYDQSKMGDEDHQAYFGGTYAERRDFELPIAAVELKSTIILYYVYMGGELVALVDKDGKVVEEYLSGPGQNSRLAVRKRTGLISGLNVLDYYNNHAGSSLFLTDNEGEIESHVPQMGTYGESAGSLAYVTKSGMWPNFAGLFESGARNFDSATGQFTAPDPLRTGAGINVYSFANNNPISLADPSGRYVESLWDAASLGVGIWSFYHNVKEGNFGSAVIDVIGIGVDSIALILPIVPGGVGASIRAYRAGKAALEASSAAYKWEKTIRTIQTIDHGVGIGQGIYQGNEDLENERYLSALFNAAMVTIGLRSLIKQRHVLKPAIKSKENPVNPTFNADTEELLKGMDKLPDNPADLMKIVNQLKKASRDGHGFNPDVEAYNSTDKLFHWKLHETTRMLERLAEACREMATIRTWDDFEAEEVFAWVFGRVYKKGGQTVAAWAGNMTDYTFKRLLQRFIDEGRFPVEDLEIVGAWQHGVDVYSRMYNAGWDITTSEAHLAHVLRDARWHDYYKVLVY